MAVVAKAAASTDQKGDVAPLPFFMFAEQEHFLFYTNRIEDENTIKETYNTYVILHILRHSNCKKFMIF